MCQILRGCSDIRPSGRSPCVLLPAKRKHEGKFWSSPSRTQHIYTMLHVNTPDRLVIFSIIRTWYTTLLSAGWCLSNSHLFSRRGAYAGNMWPVLLRLFWVLRSRMKQAVWDHTPWSLSLTEYRSTHASPDLYKQRIREGYSTHRTQYTGTRHYWIYKKDISNALAPIRCWIHRLIIVGLEQQKEGFTFFCSVKAIPDPGMHVRDV